jgi:hypothetical protein
MIMALSLGKTVPKTPETAMLSLNGQTFSRYLGCIISTRFDGWEIEQWIRDPAKGDHSTIYIDFTFSLYRQPVTLKVTYY